MTPDEARSAYKRINGLPESTRTAVLVGHSTDSGDIVVVKIENILDNGNLLLDRHRGPYLRFRADGRIETGILWGGDVWEPMGVVPTLADALNTLTVWQPHASLIAFGYKTVETRSWAPPASAIGKDLLIHAGKQPPPVFIDNYREIISPIQKETDLYWRERIPYGAIVACATLTCAHIAGIGTYTCAGDNESGNAIGLCSTASCSRRGHRETSPHAPLYRVLTN